MGRSTRWSLAGVSSLLFALGACRAQFTKDCDPLGAPGGTECKVVFYRSGGVSDTLDYPIFHQRTWIGLSSPGTFFEMLCAPGKHQFIMLSQPPGPIGGETITRSPSNWAAVEANLAPGKTYYIRTFLQAVHVAGGRAPRMAPATRGSSEMERVDEAIRDLQCTRLDPSKVHGEKPQMESRIRAVYTEIADISGEWTYLALEDGR